VCIRIHVVAITRLVIFVRRNGAEWSDRNLIAAESAGKSLLRGQNESLVHNVDNLNSEAGSLRGKISSLNSKVSSLDGEVAKLTSVRIVHELIRSQVINIRRFTRDIMYTCVRAKKPRLSTHCVLILSSLVLATGETLVPAISRHDIIARHVHMHMYSSFFASEAQAEVQPLQRQSGRMHMAQ
jgi:hypothetical protein